MTTPTPADEIRAALDLLLDGRPMPPRPDLTTPYPDLDAALPHMLHDALSMAQLDPAWVGRTDAGRQALIEARRILAAAPAPDGGETAPVCPQDATEGAPKGNDSNPPLNEPHAPVQRFGASPAPGDGLRERPACSSPETHNWDCSCHKALREALAVRWAQLGEHWQHELTTDVVTIIGPMLDERDRRAATLEHVARGNRRHVQVMHEELKQAEAALARVRQMARAWREQLPDAIRRDTAVDALLTATEKLAALDHTDTPTETTS